MNTKFFNPIFSTNINECMLKLKMLKYCQKLNEFLNYNF